MKKHHRLILVLAAVAIAAVVAQPQQVIAPGHVPPNAPLPRYVYNVIGADSAVPQGQPPVKTKFNLFLGARSDDLGVKTTPLMAALRVDNYRASMRWGGGRGGAGGAMLSGTPDKIAYNFQAQDELVKLLKSHGIELLMTYSGTPDILQLPAGPRAPGQQWVSRGGRSGPPNDLEKWKEIIRTVVRHYRDIGMPFQVHEVWNEPDGTYQFFTGTPEDYQQIYKATVEAIREVDPDAVVAGPSADHHMLWNTSFVDFVYKNKLPLDHLTFHEYGSGELAIRQIERVNSSLNRYRTFDTTALSLNEYHDGVCCNWCKDDVRNHYEGASEMLHEFTVLLGRPELFSLSWAWWMDLAKQTDSPGCMGLLNYEGRPKAVYNAWKAYAMMPVDRRQVTAEGALEGIASTDGHRASLLIWNRSSYEQRADVNLKNMPVRSGTVRVYRIDKSHASFIDGGTENLEVNESYPITEANWSYLDVTLPKYATMYIEADDNSGVSELAPIELGNIVRLNHYYPARGKTQSYADFDRHTWIARLGMQGEKTADERVGVLANRLPDTLEVATDVVGKPQKIDAASLLGIRVDYRIGPTYTKALLFHGGLYDKARNDPNPWGLKAQLDDATAVPDLGKFQIPLKKYAPAGWSGEAHISFLMQNTGPDSRVKFTVRPAR